MVDYQLDQNFIGWVKGLIAQLGSTGGAYLTYASPAGARNNVNPGSGWPNAPGPVPYSTLGVTLAAGNANWTGLLAGNDDQAVLIVNQDAANSLTLNNANAGSAAANRFAYAADLILPPGATAWAVYRATPALWYLN
jgi:hypothetical protein